MKTQLMEIANNVKFKKQVMTTTFGTKCQTFLTDPKCKNNLLGPRNQNCSDDSRKTFTK